MRRTKPTTRTVTIPFYWERDDGEYEFRVTGTVSPVIPAKVYGPPEDCYPAEGGEVEILSVKLVDVISDDVEFATLSDNQVQAIESAFLAECEGRFNSRINDDMTDKANDDFLDEMEDCDE